MVTKSVKIGIILLILFIFLFVPYAVYPTSPLSVSGPSLLISTDEARAKRFGLIIDVRSPKEREELGYYPNSIPIAIDQLGTEVPFLISSKKTDILVYSNGDNRAKVAAKQLYQNGYPNVRYISTSYLRLLPGSQ
jgi:rhodanese-related sulfurtransferase